MVNEGLSESFSRRREDGGGRREGGGRRKEGFKFINNNLFQKRKFAVFSQFLFDELIQSPLIREERFFKENKDRLNGRYPLERAENLIKEIKRLGNFEDGKNFLDKFRSLITSVGNALG